MRVRQLHRVFRAVLMLVIVVAAFPCAAQENSQPAPGSDDRLPEIGSLLGKRDIQFERSEDKYAMQLFRADPNLLAMKYVAIMTMSNADASSTGGESQVLEHGLRALANVDGRFFFDPRLGYSPKRSLDKVVLDLIDKTPKQFLPPPDDVDFLLHRTGAGYVQYSNIRELNTENPISTNQFMILAPTPERAESLACSLLTLLDQGMSRPILESLLVQIKTQVEELGREHVEHDMNRALLAERTKSLESTEEYSQDELSALRTQRRLLDVDLSGAKARIDAAGAIAERLPRGSAQLEQVENLKIGAEIELAGLAARQRTLDGMIDLGRKRLALEQEVLQIKARFDVVDQKVTRSTRQLNSMRESLKFFRPLPLVDGKVVIRPVEWREARN